ncbi:hypothetical protein HDV05_003945 [Chytridiales sp. JEL 0842]|nr:hypothetical protein HDV05_003945 [Chytridiales sp. JEL 0842]
MVFGKLDEEHNEGPVTTPEWTESSTADVLLRMGVDGVNLAAGGQSRSASDSTPSTTKPKLSLDTAAAAKDFTTSTETLADTPTVHEPTQYLCVNCISTASKASIHLNAFDKLPEPSLPSLPKLQTINNTNTTNSWKPDAAALAAAHSACKNTAVPLTPTSTTNSVSSPVRSAPSSPIRVDPKRCYGKVPDLSVMVQNKWWEKIFGDNMYLRTDGDVVEDPEITVEEIQMLQRESVINEIFQSGAAGEAPKEGRGRARVLDLCCGQGRHTLQLAKDFPGLELYGHDQSSYLISLACERAASADLTANTRFTVGDCRQIPYEADSFDLVLLMGNSFGYFSSDDSDRQVLAEVKRVLKPGGYLVLDLTDGGYMRSEYSPRSWEWIDDSTFVCRERQLSKDGLRLVSREVITSVDEGVIRDQFYQERLYAKEELEVVIEEMGLQIPASLDGALSNLTSAKDLSKRQEDLGMMENRMLITAQKPVVNVAERRTGFAERRKSLTSTETLSTQLEQLTLQHPPISISSEVIASDAFALSGFDKVTVIMGDPSQPCFGKLNDTWNEEDYLTRQNLYDATSKLGFRNDQLRILEKHSDLLQTLLTEMPSFVFNLCDEGFDNDALKELHVPAILEMLRIPYSGAGPNCLAYCYDKGLVNRTAEALGVPTPREISFLSELGTPAVPADLDYLHQLIVEKITYPAFIKPIKGDNSLGITSRSIINNKADLKTCIESLHAIGIRDVVVQEYLRGSEYGVGMIGNVESGFHFFPILEVDYSKIIERKLPPILGFESKWDPSSPYWTEISYKRAKLHPDVEKKLKACCVVLWERFGCRDYARFDFRCDVGSGHGFFGVGDDENAKGSIKLLEVNPNPGWCWDGKLAYMGKLEGKAYHEVVGMVLKAAHQRLFESKATKNP